MKTIKIFLLILFSAIVFVSCEEYTNNVEPPNNLVDGAKLTQESQINFLITGILQRNSTVSPYAACMSDLLSDEMLFTTDVRTASFPSFRDIDNGDILIDNTDVTSVYSGIHELRYFADSLIDRSNQITFASDALKKKAYFTGYFYGALTRYYLGAYFGDPETQQFGATINNSPFIPQNQLYEQAINLYKLALNNAPSALDTRVTNSMIAKVYLSRGDYANAATFAALGMKKGDAPYVTLHSDISNVYHWGFAGAGRVQIIVNSRFNTYITQDPLEFQNKPTSDRLQILPVTGRSGTKYYYQNKYPLKSSSFVMMTWQENNLMLAEAVVRGAGAGDALALVNEVRTSHILNPLTAVNLDVIYAERDKELFVQGARFVDQQRFNKWHLAAGKAKFLPIPRREKDGNPNY